MARKYILRLLTNPCLNGKFWNSSFMCILRFQPDMLWKQKIISFVSLHQMYYIFHAPYKQGMIFSLLTFIVEVAIVRDHIKIFIDQVEFVNNSGK